VRLGSAAVTAGLITAMVVGVPAAAFAYQFDRREFNPNTLGTQRLPSSGGKPYAATSGTGTLLSDAPGSPCNDTFNWQLIRARTALPDVVQREVDNNRFCDPQLIITGSSWPAGTYHWNVRVVNRPVTVSGVGAVEARWP
jgi:hypothetical protein